MKRKLILTSYLCVLLVFTPLTLTNSASGRISMAAAKKLGVVESFDGSNYSSSVSMNLNSPLVSIGDKQVSEVWSQVTTYPVASYGEIGRIASVHDRTHVYFLLQFELNYEWIAIQWDADNSSNPEDFKDEDMQPMALGDDMWVFGSTSANIYGDSAAKGQADPYIQKDLQNDISWEVLTLNDTNGESIAKVVEVSRPLYTGDVNGADVTFSHQYNISMYFASEVNHRPDSNIVNAKFYLSNNPVGGGDEVTIAEEEPVVGNELFPYMFYYLGIAITFTGILYGIVIYFGVSRVSKGETL